MSRNSGTAMTPEQLQGIYICIVITLMTLAVAPVLVFGLGDRKA